MLGIPRALFVLLLLFDFSVSFFPHHSKLAVHIKLRGNIAKWKIYTSAVQAYIELKYILN